MASVNSGLSVRISLFPFEGLVIRGGVQGDIYGH